MPCGWELPKHYALIIQHYFMKRYLLFSLLTLPLWANAQNLDPVVTELWTPVPRVVKPGEGTKPPADAIVLFDGLNTNEWYMAKDSAACKWTVADGAITVVPNGGGIQSKRNFGDCQLHIEFRTPVVVKGEGQGRGNSGIFLQNRYELQVLDCYQNTTYSNGQTASMYKQSIPLVNACRPPGEWQMYDILYTAPRFNADGMLVVPGRITVLHNGVVAQLNTEIKGTTEYRGLPRIVAHGKGPLHLQDHGDLVSYRNIWIREL